MPSKEPPRRRVPGPARSRDAAGGPGRARPAARAQDRRPRRPAAPGKRRGASPQSIRLGSPRPRLRLISLCLTLVMLAFVVRLLQVQAVDANAYTAKAEKNRYLEYTIAAERGEITDRSGIALATSVDAHDITADPKLFTPEDSKAPDAPQQAAALLAPILGKDEAELAKKLSTPKSRYTVLARRQTPQVWKQIKDLKSVFAEKAAEDRAKGGPGANVLAGVLQEPTTRRVYPNGGLAAGILGFVNAEGKGGGGLEAQLNKKLQGEDGKIRYAQAGGRPVPTAGSTEIPAVAGTDVELTIDRDIQWAAQRAIADQVEKSKADRGYVIVQNTKTGEVLAMANAPGYDPNDLAQSNSAALGNAALQDVYEPGSTSKVMSMAAVLEEGAATPGTHVTVPNRLHRGDRLFRDDIDHPTWYLTLNGVLAKSSNIGTILATGQLGKTQPEANKVLHSYLRKFGLGSTTGLDYPGESPGILAKPQDWSTSQQYTIPFGQGLSLNAMQAASVYQTIANGGVRIEPTLVRGTKDADDRYTASDAPKRTRVVSEKTAGTLAKMLESVVDDREGTGTKAHIQGYRVAGKTGTANRVDPVRGVYKGYTASFAGFAPADDPQVTVYCAIQNPTEGSYFGGQICGPIYKKVMEFALKTLQTPPSGKAPARMPVSFKPGE
ncbi:MULTISPECIES: penicillin-binding protein 2 [Streptomyces]|uniref:Penicillin-binding transpeptidase domain-containing protein n=3 Tax=Streptomyces TaxID=1883 RepID=A0ABY9JM08_9ACTN|nr:MULTISPECIES: penicillin-binding protein 2 [unclassified Streptomyces]WSQ80468.1 penicillin-binding transpeptidase domain-containing protein [Streptomyces sp. NBC_01213]TXS09639.1 cell division protein [Streptomyces sp. wa22]WLQ67047.1 penicillin-binding transpeptidase domain-containing protein [Streptomyces sp. Alt3]WSQ87801.1 penicillin-binding transpeptidase domain-containing protein [Streptomyces sp. NBC_01212]WSR06192.1 penicillin-binding transpeptidase domain-containing protein [Strep